MPPDRRVTPEERRDWHDAMRGNVPMPLPKASAAQRSRKAAVPEKPSSRLDLHGFTLANAHNAVTAFIKAAAAARLQDILIITGKGRNSPAGQATLRNEVPRWLSVPPLKALIHSASEASVADGGKGALKVRLRQL